MSSIGVVVFRNSSLGNTQVLQESVNNTVNITNNDSNKNVRREIIIVRKKQKVQLAPTTVSVTSLLNSTDTANSNVPLKRSRPRENSADDPGRTPTPLAVARRNARERNRVRQVNDGFAALRRHIPDEVAAEFESANSNRGPNKKLSKVETLRMAVEYIRNLESLLNIGHADKENANQPLLDSFPSPASSSPRERSHERSYFSHSPALDDDDLDDDEIDGSLQHLRQQQYIDIRAPENFQLVSTPHLYDEEEGQPMTPSSDLLGQDEINQHIGEGHFPFPSSAEQFTMIDQNYCDEPDIYKSNSNFQIKFGETDHERVNYNDETELPLDMNADLILPQGAYKFKSEDDAFLENEFSEIELKKELPDIHVTPEDREQFEETLKWWQEKTRQVQPSSKNKN